MLLKLVMFCKFFLICKEFFYVFGLGDFKFIRVFNYKYENVRIGRYFD